VGNEVKVAFVDKIATMQQAFQGVDSTHYLADLYALARMTLLSCGVKRMYGGEHCTYNQADQFYSFRREPVTGRMASLIWLQP
jgi:copper oxidase (laccase) domain-containing protein